MMKTTFDFCHHFVFDGENALNLLNGTQLSDWLNSWLCFTTSFPPSVHHSLSLSLSFFLSQSISVSLSPSLSHAFSYYILTNSLTRTSAPHSVSTHYTRSKFVWVPLLTLVVVGVCVCNVSPSQVLIWSWSVWVFSLFLQKIVFRVDRSVCL